MDTKAEYFLAEDDPVGSIISSTAVRPQRNRSRPQEAWQEQKKTENRSERKKANTKRQAPARGRYIDEYARPARGPAM